MNEQIRTAKAVVDIDEVHFLKHSPNEPVISQEVLDGEDWFSVATLKGTVSVTQDALSLTKINIDQSDMPIGISTEPGDFNVEFSMPSLVKENLNNWLTGQKVSTLTLSGKKGYGYDFNATLAQMCMAIKTKTGEWFVFPNIQGSVGFAQEDKTFILKFTGMVLGASNDANNDVYIFNEDAPSSSSGGL